MQISRRRVLTGAGAAAVAAGVPRAVQAVDPEEHQLLTVLRQLPDDRRAMIHHLSRSFAGLPDDPELMRRWGFDGSEPDGEARS